MNSSLVEWNKNRTGELGEDLKLKIMYLYSTKMKRKKNMMKKKVNTITMRKLKKKKKLCLMMKLRTYFTVEIIIDTELMRKNRAT